MEDFAPLISPGKSEVDRPVEELIHVQYIILGYLVQISSRSNFEQLALETGDGKLWKSIPIPSCARS